MVKLYQRTQAATHLVEPSAPMWAHRMVLKMLEYFETDASTDPEQIWNVDTKTSLPNAADYLGAMCYVVDIGTLVVSVGTSWQKLTMGGPV